MFLFEIKILNSQNLLLRCGAEMTPKEMTREEFRELATLNPNDEGDREKIMAKGITPDTGAVKLIIDGETVEMNTDSAYFGTLVAEK